MIGNELVRDVLSAFMPARSKVFKLLLQFVKAILDLILYEG